MPDDRRWGFAMSRVTIGKRTRVENVKTIWPKDAPREHKCDAPCMGFPWLGCDEACRKNGCEILSKFGVQEVLDMARHATPAP